MARAPLQGAPLRQHPGIRDSAHRGILVIHQELALCPQLSIVESIFLGNEQAHRGLIDWNKTSHEAAQLLARVGLAENPVTPVMDLGVGKQQLVEIAKALSTEVKLLILDEPSAALHDEDSAHARAPVAARRPTATISVARWNSCIRHARERYGDERVGRYGGGGCRASVIRQ